MWLTIILALIKEGIVTIEDVRATAKANNIPDSQLLELDTEYEARIGRAKAAAHPTPSS